MQYDYVVVDSHNLAYVQWWHVQDLKHNGVPTGMEFGFIRKVLGLMASHPGRVCLAWDGRPTRCAALIENYKEGRKEVEGEPPWRPRLTRLREAFADVCPTLYDEQEEADEQIARFVLQNKGKRIQIISNDKDLQQLIGPTVHVWCNQTLLDAEGCLQKWGVPSFKIPLYKALDGDGSDNLPGVPRLRTTTKIKLVNRADTVFELLEHFRDDDLTANEKAKLAAHRDQVMRNHTAVDLRSLLPLVDLRLPRGDWSALRTLASELGLSSLAIPESVPVV